jgi:hypothetical protein
VLPRAQTSEGIALNARPRKEVINMKKLVVVALLAMVAVGADLDGKDLQGDCPKGAVCDCGGLNCR